MWEELNLKGQIIKSVEYEDNSETLIFIMENNEKYRMYHEQDCCESVSIDFDESCNLKELEGEKILDFEEDANQEETEYGSSTKTTFTFTTENGVFKIVWYGESNGYYSEGVSFYKVKK